MFTKLPNLLFISFVLLLFLSCSKDDVEANTAVVCQTLETGTTIMPLGASRVQGFPPFFESYRYELWKDLLDGGWEFDFVGTFEDTVVYATYKNYCFDNDHEGRAGWTAARIDENIDTWLDQSKNPDIVLFSSPGGNDILDGGNVEDALVHVNSIIDKIQAHNPNVTILIEILAPAKSTYMDEEGLAAILSQMKAIIDGIAQNKTTTTSTVVAVDMATGFSDDFLADDIHYNKAGAAFIAERYYDALIPFLK